MKVIVRFGDFNDVILGRVPTKERMSLLSVVIRAKIYRLNLGLETTREIPQAGKMSEILSYVCVLAVV